MKVKDIVFKKTLSLMLASAIALNINGCSKADYKDKIIKEYSKNGVETNGNKIGTNSYEISSINSEKMENRAYITAKEKSQFINNKMETICETEQLNEVIGGNNPSWGDVLTALLNNNNFPKEIKEILVNGINNLKAKNVDIDLSALYENMESMTFEYNTEKVKSQDKGALAYYDPLLNKIICPRLEDWPEDYNLRAILCHEGIGHPVQERFIKDAKVHATNIPYCIQIVDEKNFKLIKYGNSLREYICDKIAYLASDEKIYDGYVPTNILYDIYTNGLGISLKKLVGTGEDEIFNKENYQMEYNIIEELDMYINSFKTGAPSERSYSDLIVITYYEVISYMKNIGYSDEEITLKLSNIIRENYYSYKTCNYNGSSALCISDLKGGYEYITCEDYLSYVEAVINLINNNNKTKKLN